ncbi:MAG TPA: type II toxin-antitoxin system RelE/ParE family toxin [Rhizomicrobium sp.]|jgi:phage-related protein|nr:type II toxin-antitoxin system RelE/ParE family toxin [Rhizomicrobium sp.]
MTNSTRPLHWIASSKKDFQAFPEDVQDGFGYALHRVQVGEHPPEAKPWKGLGSGVFELADVFDGDAYRTVYAVRFREAIYVLHAFKKKSKHGIATPASDIALVKRRLAEAMRDHTKRFGQET